MGKRAVGEKIFMVMNYILLIAFAIICFYPFYYVFLYSLSDPKAVELQGIFLLPVSPSLQTYKEVFERSNILAASVISASRAIFGTVVTVGCCSFFGYLVSRKEMPYRKIIYRMCVMTMYISAGLIPWYMTMKMIGLKNNYLNELC